LFDRIYVIVENMSIRIDYLLKERQVANNRPSPKLG